MPDARPLKRSESLRFGRRAFDLGYCIGLGAQFGTLMVETTISPGLTAPNTKLKPQTLDPGLVEQLTQQAGPVPTKRFSNWRIWAAQARKPRLVCRELEILGR